MPALGRSALALVACLSLVLAAPSPGMADELEDLTTTWSSYLPAYVDEFTPASADDCIAGRDQCATKTVHEMNKRLETLATSCSHNAVFALAYQRISEGYIWIRDTEDADGSPHYDDRAGLNFIVEVFARAYFYAYDEWAAGRMPSAAWKLALDAARDKRVSGSGDLLLGISAHINRDLPFVLAASGLVSPDGTSRKPDYDKVNVLLWKLTKPLTAEQSERFDPTMANGSNSLLDPATFQAIVSWRERAWRNAEALVGAKSDAERALVAERIEATALTEGALILSSSAYVPPLTTTKARDDYCAGHKTDVAPLSYPFKTS